MGWNNNKRDCAYSGLRCCACVLGLVWCLGVVGCGLTRTVQIESIPSGATLWVDDERYPDTPYPVKLTWKKDSQHKIELAKENYATTRRYVAYNAAKSQSSKVPWTIIVPLDEVRREVALDIVANVRGATISVNDREVGQTDGRHTFVFVRDDGQSPWSSFFVVVDKDGYRYLPADDRMQPGEAAPFATTLTIDHPAVVSGKLDVELAPIRFVRTKVRRWIPTRKGIQLEVEDTLAEIETEIVVHAATKITDADPADAFMETRISVVPGGQDILYSFPHKLAADGSVCANLWVQQGAARRRLTDGPTRDLEATVSPDGRWVYFSSDRLGQNRSNIWRISLDSQGGFQKITDSPASSVDTEPAISPDGRTMAYTSYLRGANGPQVWTAEVEGALRTQIRSGKSPTWSPDGRRLAFSARDDNGYEQIWIIESRGGPPTQVTSGNHRHRHPVFTPDGGRIVYASDQALNEVGLANFDIWIMDDDGNGKTQLTVNGSYDSRPVISQDGQYIYFVSNRGAVHEFDEAMQIWRLPLQPDFNAPLASP